ncbi:MAG: heavy-metal-associated domain-containing protein [Chloroflexi bacterium]|nr:heavy-metal-associated domain-containing protein [Chloroflexota bacterium]
MTGTTGIAGSTAAATRTLTFTVTGEEKIHCAGCEQRITRALLRLHGVQSVHASAQNQEVLAMVDPTQVGPDQVRAKLRQLGYKAEPQGVAL